MQKNVKKLLAMASAVVMTMSFAAMSAQATALDISQVQVGDWIKMSDYDTFSNFNINAGYSTGLANVYSFTGTGSLRTEIENMPEDPETFTPADLEKNYYKVVDTRVDESSGLANKTMVWFGLDNPRVIGCQADSTGQKYRAILPLTRADLKDTEVMRYMAWPHKDPEGGEIGAIISAYSYFYQNGVKYTVEDYNRANGTDYVAFAIIGTDQNYSKSMMFRFYKNSDSEDNFVCDAAVSFTKKAVN